MTYSSIVCCLSAVLVSIAKPEDKMAAGGLDWRLPQVSGLNKSVNGIVYSTSQEYNGLQRKELAAILH
jgi:hypothetical protein